MSRKKEKNTNKKTKEFFVSIIAIIAFVIGGFVGADKLNLDNENNLEVFASNSYTNINIKNIPEYSGKIYIEINNDIPYFEESDYTTKSFEKYGSLDDLGRCTAAYANISKETMPPKGDERGSISSIKPTGWVQEKYDGEYLYNRCHLIGYQLSDEDANELNLITGTRYFNVQGMLPFENMVADYINENENSHVLYRVTPIFKEDNLLASGVEMEAYSVEDNGKGICFNVFVYNVEPGINIDYTTGKSTKVK